MRNQFHKLGFLAGEFVVVVVGVLVALAVDQWSEARTDRVIETRYLQRLKADLEWDTAHFARFDHIALRAKAEILRDLVAPDATARLRARPTLVEDLNYSSFVALPTNRPATFEELQSTGRLSLIQDIELRGAISHYYAGFNHISRIMATPFGDYRKRLESALPGPAFYDWRLGRVEPDTAELVRALASLLQDEDLKAAVNSELAYTAAMTFYLRDYRAKAAQLLKRLNGE